MASACHLTTLDDTRKLLARQLLGNTLVSEECVELALEVAETEGVSLDHVLPRIAYEMVNVLLFMSEWDIAVTLDRLALLTNNTFTPGE